MLKFICYPKCTTCQKARKWLDENNIEYEFRDIKIENPTLEELTAWYKLSGLPLRKFFNTSGLLYKSMELKTKLPNMTDEEMLEYYEQTNMSSGLFDFQSDEAREETVGNYLLTPLRGLLATVVVIVALAASMYYIRDRKNGTFAWVPASKQILPELASHFTAVFFVTLTALCALLLCGLAGPILPELATLLVYGFCVCGFVMVLRRLCVSVRVLGIAMPLLVVVMFVVCPVFVDLAVFRHVQLALPPTYYVNAIANPAYLLYGLGYILVCAGFCLVWDKLTSK